MSLEGCYSIGHKRPRTQRSVGSHFSLPSDSGPPSSGSVTNGKVALSSVRRVLRGSPSLQLRKNYDHSFAICWSFACRVCQRAIISQPTPQTLYALTLNAQVQSAYTVPSSSMTLSRKGSEESADLSCDAPIALPLNSPAPDGVGSAASKHTAGCLLLSEALLLWCRARSITSDHLLELVDCRAQRWRAVEVVSCAARRRSGLVQVHLPVTPARLTT